MLCSFIEKGRYKVKMVKERKIILYTDKSECCGCGACYNICPFNAIEMKADEEGFLYPEINLKKCRLCGLCNKSCDK